MWNQTCAHKTQNTDQPRVKHYIYISHIAFVQSGLWSTLNCVYLCVRIQTGISRRLNVEINSFEKDTELLHREKTWSDAEIQHGYSQGESSVARPGHTCKHLYLHTHSYTIDALSVPGKVYCAYKSNFTARALENWRLEEPREAQAVEINCRSSWEKL